MLQSSTSRLLVLNALALLCRLAATLTSPAGRHERPALISYPFLMLDMPI